MADEALSGQYSVIAPFLAPLVPAWLSGDSENALRLAAYVFYERLYWNDAGGFKLTLRGDEDFPVYVPSARRIINTFNRYVARGLSISITGDDAFVEAAQLAYDTLFKREKFYSLFKHSKKMGLVRGDWVLGIFANPFKPEGARISIVDIPPSKYFPELDSNRKPTGQRIMESVHIGDKDYVRVQRWIRVTNPDHPSYNEETPDYTQPIAYSDITYEQENFNDPEKRKAFKTDIPLTLLDGIITLPLYHFQNDHQTDDTYGSSDLRGLERIFLAINQTATDEDVAIAMAGLGMYVADSTPVDEDGKETDWVLGPKRVVEVPKDGKFERITGVASVEPTQGHMDWLQEQAQSVLGISDVALGQVDTAVAESGIALALRMGPLLDASGDRDEEISDVLIQFLHDLKQWFAIYERINLGDDLTGATIMPTFADKLPTNKKDELDRLAELFLNKVIPVQFYWSELRRLGVDLPKDDDLIRMFAEQTAAGIADPDPEGTRLAAEANAGVVDNGGLE
jgi:hypothetical protein